MSMPGRKVVHLTSVHGATDTRILHKECVTLAQSGYDVVLVAPGEQRAPWAGVRHRAVPLPRNRIDRLTRTMWHVLKAALDEKADIYHFHDPELIGAGLVLRMRGARVVYDVHEDVPLDIRTKPWIPKPVRGVVSAAARTVLRAVQNAFSAIVPATPSIAESFTHRRTVIVRNYPRFDELAARDGGPPYEERSHGAIYLGAITYVRGLGQMLDAIAHPSLPQDARLILAGEFEDANTLERAGAHAGWQRAISLGPLRRDQLAAAFARARVGLLVLQPFESFEESLPTKLFEYMGAGLPVIASKFLRCRELIQECACGVVVDPRDGDEIAEAMRGLFADPTQAKAMGARGRQVVAERYRWDSEGENLVSLYAAIA
jgi:glycosyltransferase involved in cell wall biosynthesis